MPLNAAGLNAAASGFTSVATHISLHSADPGTTGANQTTAARLPAGWGAPTDGDITITAKNFTGGAANGPVTHVGFFSQLATGGTFYGSQALTGDATFNAAGEYTLTSLTLDFD